MAGRPICLCSRSSTSAGPAKKRLWVINVRAGKELFHTLVAHGKASGTDVPLAFSNKDGSEMSILGSYCTAPITYTGKHEVSIKIPGLDPGLNTNAASRAVVIHRADCVRTDFVRAHGRLGRSQCPVLPVAQTAAIVRASRAEACCTQAGPRGPATARSG